MPEHGTRSNYVKGCHCPECTRANAAYQKVYQRDRRRKRGLQRYPAQHGSNSKYATGCRCDDCKAAHSWAGRIYWARKKREKKISV